MSKCWYYSIILSIRSQVLFLLSFLNRHTSCTQFITASLMNTLTLVFEHNKPVRIDNASWETDLLKPVMTTSSTCTRSPCNQPQNWWLYNNGEPQCSMKNTVAHSISLFPSWDYYFSYRLITENGCRISFATRMPTKHYSKWAESNFTLWMQSALLHQAWGNICLHVVRCQFYLRFICV